MTIETFNDQDFTTIDILKDDYSIEQKLLYLLNNGPITVDTACIIINENKSKVYRVFKKFLLEDIITRSKYIPKAPKIGRPRFIYSINMKAKK
ncbi:MAG: hypothetical protein ACTSVI_01680 [Promethearchaeota archaeon]